MADESSCSDSCSGSDIGCCGDGGVCCGAAASARAVLVLTPVPSWTSRSWRSREEVEPWVEKEST